LFVHLLSELARMPKAKKAPRQDVVGSSSQRGRQGEEPVTDTVMQVIARRIRNAKKKMQKVNTIEALLKDGSTLNEDQVFLPRLFKFLDLL